MTATPDRVTRTGRAVSSGVTSEMPVLSASALVDPDCAQCGTELQDDQEWCLECGAARTLIHRPPDWRIPIAILGTIVVLVVAGFAIALIDLSKRTNATTRAAGGEPAASAAAAPPAAAPAAAPPRAPRSAAGQSA